jgi:uncharacterized protein YbcC (UPF0753/DUF2309 family)
MMVGYTHESTTLWSIWDPDFDVVRTQSEVIFDKEQNAYVSCTQPELIFLDCHQNTLTNFILEMDFSEHIILQLERVEMDFSTAVPRISVERVKATEVVITATLMMSQMSIAICPMTILIEVSLHVQVRDHILLTRGIQSFSHIVVIIAHASHRHREKTLNTAYISAARITLPAVKP